MIEPVLLKIAKTAILKKFDQKYKINKQHLIEQYPFLNESGACFVTLNKNDNLRGCIGSIISHTTLLEDVISNAQNAAFNDPRFDELTIEELSQLTLEVSVLTKPEFLKYDNFTDLLMKIRPNIDGLILRHHHFQGTFLPQVWEQLPSAKTFLEHLSYKAGANPTIYNEHPQIYTYQVEALKENFDAILPL